MEVEEPTPAAAGPVVPPSQMSEVEAVPPVGEEGEEGEEKEGSGTGGEAPSTALISADIGHGKEGGGNEGSNPNLPEQSQHAPPPAPASGPSALTGVPPLRLEVSYRLYSTFWDLQQYTSQSPSFVDRDEVWKKVLERASTVLSSFEMQPFTETELALSWRR